VQGGAGVDAALTRGRTRGGGIELGARSRGPRRQKREELESRVEAGARQRSIAGAVSEPRQQRREEPKPDAMLGER